MSDIEALKNAGHSTAKALEILLDAKRGDSRAEAWVVFIRKEFAR